MDQKKSQNTRIRSTKKPNKKSFQPPEAEEPRDARHSGKGKPDASAKSGKSKPDASAKSDIGKNPREDPPSQLDADEPGDAREDPPSGKSKRDADTSATSSGGDTKKRPDPARDKSSEKSKPDANTSASSAGNKKTRSEKSKEELPKEKNKPEEPRAGDPARERSKSEEADTSSTSSAGHSKQKSAEVTSKGLSLFPKKSAEVTSQGLPSLDGMKPLARGWKLDGFPFVADESRHWKKNTGKTDASGMKIQESSSSGTSGGSSAKLLQETGSSNREGSTNSDSATSGRTSGKQWASVTAVYRPDITAYSPRKEEITSKATKGKKPIAELIPTLTLFLKEFEKPGDGNSAYYPSQALAMNARKSELITIDFNHILSKRIYVDLALKIGNESSHEWMQVTVLEFLQSCGYELTKVNIAISNKPKSISYIEDYMLRQACWDNFSCCKERVDAATTHGRIGLLAGIRGVIDKHKDRISYGGRFTKEDMLIMNSKTCVLYGDPLECNGRNCKLDMSSVWSLFEPYFDISHHSTQELYPLEFDDLIEELTAVEESRVLNPTYRELVGYYPTLAPPAAREDFAKKFCLAIRKLQFKGIPLDPFLRAIPSGEPSTWSTIMGHADEDWRAEFLPRVDSILDRTFWHEYDKKIGGRQNFVAVRNIMLPLDETVSSQVICKRNVLEHAHEHGATDAPDMIELYATSKFKHLMGYLYKKILELSPEERNRKFGHVIRSYKKLFD